MATRSLFHYLLLRCHLQHCIYGWITVVTHPRQLLSINTSSRAVFTEPYSVARRRVPPAKSMPVGRKWNVRVFLVKSGKWGVFCTKVDLSSTQLVHYVQYQYFFYFTYYLFGGGGAYAPNAPTTYGPVVWLRPILVHSKNCKTNTLSMTKHYAELTAAKCTVFHSLCISNTRINIKICIKISF